MINELLSKFYNGETSPAEERQLLSLLEENPTPEHEADRRLLRALCAPMPDFSAMAEKASAQSPQRVIRFYRLRVAAAIAILLTAAGAFFYSPKPQEDISLDRARETTIMALSAYNKAINHSLDKLNNL